MNPGLHEGAAQAAWDRAEDAAEALHHLAGLIEVLETELDAALRPEREHRIWPLVAAIRERGAAAAGAIDTASRSLN